MNESGSFKKRNPILLTCHFLYRQEKCLGIVKVDPDTLELSEEVVVTVTTPGFPYENREFLMERKKLTFRPYVECYYQGYEATFNVFDRLLYIIDDDCPYPKKMEISVEDTHDLRFPTFKEYLVKNGLIQAYNPEKIIAEERGEVKKVRHYGSNKNWDIVRNFMVVNINIAN